MLSDPRLSELEVKVALQDELLDALNFTLSRQQQQIDSLQQQLQLLCQQLRERPEQMGHAGHENPPHY